MPQSWLSEPKYLGFGGCGSRGLEGAGVLVAGLEKNCWIGKFRAMA
jgi:hypothetical protein